MCVCVRMGGAEEGTGGVGGLAAATVDHATMWDIANEEARREGRKAAAGGVEICFGDRLVGSEASEMDTHPRGPLLDIAGPTRSSMRPARLGKQALDLSDCCVCVRVRPVAFLLVDLVVGPRQV